MIFSEFSKFFVDYLKKILYVYKYGICIPFIGLFINLVIFISMKTTYIYILSDPITNEIRYVGKTINIERRLNQHVAESVKAKNHKASWIKSLIKKGVVPKIEIIDEIKDENWEWLEIYWISQFKAWGFDLVNSTTGGGKSVFNENAKLNMSLGQRGKKRSKENNWIKKK